MYVKVKFLYLIKVSHHKLKIDKMKTQVDNQPKHTQGELRLVKGRYIFAGKGGATKIVAECKPHTDLLAPQTNVTKQEAEANAQRIVKAVNMHDSLINVSKDVFEHLKNLRASKDKELDIIYCIAMLETILKKNEQ